jgi:hypothetical protein
MDRVDDVLDDIAAGRRDPASLIDLAKQTGEPTTLIRLRAEERGLVVRRDVVYPAEPSWKKNGSAREPT